MLFEMIENCCKLVVDYIIWYSRCSDVYSAR